MRCASVSVGIVAYEYKAYRESSMRLVHATADGFDFHQYARTAWDSKEDVHHLLRDDNAGSASLDAAFQDIVDKGHFDILIVYLSGHGELGSEHAGWFCLADARPGLPSLGPKQLDWLLGQVSADRTLLLVDCCHAEAAIAGMRFFGSLDGKLARLFVASARVQQQAWEDDALKRSLFSDVLLRALSSDSDIAEAGTVDLEARLLPRLREQVPLNAAMRKRGAVQEPVSGGCSVTATKLPTVSSQSLGRELSVAETVRRRARRVLGATGLALVVALLLADGLAYHLAVAGSGEIMLRPGFPATFGLLPFHLGREADTGLALTDMNPADDALLARLGNASVSGISGHIDERGLRPWLGELEPGLKPARRASVSALATGKPTPFAPDNESPPLRETAFVAALTHRSISEVGRELYPLAPTLDIGCGENAGRHLDMDLLLAETDVFVRDVDWLAVTAPDDVRLRVNLLSDLVLLSAYRSFQQKAENSRAAELRALAYASWRLASGAPDPERFRRAAVERLLPLQRQWCAIHGRLALGLLSPVDEPGASAEAELLSLFRRPYEEDRLAEPTGQEQLATVALAEIGRRGLLRPPTLDVVEAFARREGLDMSDVNPASTLLRAIAPSQRLPESLIAALLEKMRAAPKEFDFSPLAAFAVLASNARFLQPVDLAQVQQWAAKNGSEQRTMSAFHRGLGHLAAAAGGLEPWQGEILEARLSPLSRFSPAALNYRGVPIITATDDDALVALGRAARVSAIPSRTADRLANAAAGRPLLEERGELLKGLAEQWYRGVDTAGLAQAVVDRFSRARLDATRRDLEVEVAAERIVRLPTPETQQITSQLISRWKEEREPELRVAVASAIALAAVVAGR